MTEFISKRVKNVRNDVLSGITVALALIPEAVAFAFVAGVDPLVRIVCCFYDWIDYLYFWWKARNDFWSYRRPSGGHGFFGC